MKHLLFFKVGPFFDPTSELSRSKYECLSADFSGDILAVLHTSDFLNVQMGRFQLRGIVLPKRIRYSIFRSILFFIYGFFTAVFSHYFRRKYDAIVTYDPFVCGLLALAVGAFTGAKTVVEINGNYASETNWDSRISGWGGFIKRRYCQFIIPFVLRHTTAIKLLYPGQIEGFLDGDTWESKTYCFHDFVPVSYVNSFSRVTENTTSPFILFAGTPWYTKGVDVLIKAFQSIMDEFPQHVLKLVIYCTPQDKALLDGMINKPEKIHLLPPMQYESLMELIAECTLFVLPSRSEGMGRVLLESMALKKPIIATRVDGIPNYIKHGETGLLVEPENVEELANAMCLMLTDNILRENISKEGYRYVFEHLSEKVYLQEFRVLIEKITLS